MVGLICKILIDLVRAKGGEDAVVKVKQKADVPLEKDYKLNIIYSDAEWQRLFGAACDVLQVTRNQAEGAYADFFCKDAINRWPMWFQMSKNSREFLERQPAIHNSLGACISDESQRHAVSDKFLIEQSDDGIVTHYNSPNQHCGLYKALAWWIIHHYGDEAIIEERLCMKHGASECEIHIRWSKVGFLT